MGFSNKPPLGSVIDWRHPLTKGLKACFLFNERGGAVFTDLVRQARGTWVNGVSYVRENHKCNPALSQYGIILDPAGTYGPNPGTTDMTVVSRHVYDSATPATGIVNKKGTQAWNYATGWYLEYWNTIPMRFVPSGGSFYPDIGPSHDTLNLYDGLLKTWAWQVRGVIVTLFMDGAPIGVTADITGATSLYSIEPLVLGNIATTYVANIEYSHLYIYDRSLTQNEIQWLNFEPYSFIQSQPITKKYWSGFTINPDHIHDNFNRDNADPIGGNWSTRTGTLDEWTIQNCKLVSNKAMGRNDGTYLSIAYWNANTFENDQYAEATRYLGHASNDCYPIVRCSTSNLTLYTCSTGPPDNIYLTKLVNGVGTYLDCTGEIVTGDVADGQVWRLEVEGTSLRLYIDGVLKLSATDSSIASGQPGILFWVYADDTDALDNFKAGNLSKWKYVDSASVYDSTINYTIQGTGNLLVCCIKDALPMGFPSDTKGHTWTLAKKNEDGPYVYIYYAIANSTGSCTFSYADHNDPGIAILEYELPYAGNVVVDQTQKATGSVSLIEAPPFTTTMEDELIIAIGGLQGEWSGWTAGDDYTIREQVGGSSFGVEDQTVVAKGSYTASITATTNGYADALALATFGVTEVLSIDVHEDIGVSEYKEQSIAIAYFGYNFIPNTENFNWQVMFWNDSDTFICPGFGPQAVVELSAYCKYKGTGTPGHMRLGVYDLAGNVICHGTDEITINNTSPAWYGHIGAGTITWEGGTTLTGGVAYKIAWAYRGGGTGTELIEHYDSAGGVTIRVNITDDYSDLPPALPSSDDNSYRRGWRCGVQPAGGEITPSIDVHDDITVQEYKNQSKTGIELISYETQTLAQNSSSTSITIPSDCTFVIVHLTGYTEHVRPFSDGSYTINSAPLSLLLDLDPDMDYHQGTVMYRANPSVGSQTFAYNYDVSMGYGVAAIFLYFKGVDTLNPIRDSHVNAGNSYDAMQYLSELTVLPGDYVCAFALVTGNVADVSWSGVTGAYNYVSTNSQSECCYAQNASPTGNVIVGFEIGSGDADGHTGAVTLRRAGDVFYIDVHEDLTVQEYKNQTALAYFGLCTSDGTVSGDTANDNPGVPVAFWNGTEVWTCPGNGNQTVKEISLYCKEKSGSFANIRLAVFSLDGNTKICEGTAQVAVTGTDYSWQGHLAVSNITPNPATLQGGTSYKLVCSADSLNEANDIYMRAKQGTSGIGLYKLGDLTGGFGTTLPSPSSNNIFVQAIRCGVQPAGGEASLSIDVHEDITVQEYKNRTSTAVLTGTPVGITWSVNINPPGQIVTVPDDCTAVYLFWRYYSNGDYGVDTITLNGNNPSDSYEYPVVSGLASTGVFVWYYPSPGDQILDILWDILPDYGPTCILAFVKGGQQSWTDVDADAGSGSETTSVTIDANTSDLVLKFDSVYGTNPPSLSSGWTSKATHGQMGVTAWNSSRLSQCDSPGTSVICDSEDENYSGIVGISIPASGDTFTLVVSVHEDISVQEYKDQFKTGEETLTIDVHEDIGVSEYKNQVIPTYFGLLVDSFGAYTGSTGVGSGSQYNLWMKTGVACPDSGTQNILSLGVSLYNLSGSGQIRLGIYDSSGNLVCQGTSRKAIPSPSEAWVIWTAEELTGTITLTGGETYKVFLDQYDNSVSSDKGGPSGGTAYNSIDYRTGLPSTLPSSSGDWYGYPMRIGIAGSGAEASLSIDVHEDINFVTKLGQNYYDVDVHDDVTIQEYLNKALIPYYVNVYDGIGVQEYQDKKVTTYFINVYDNASVQEYQDKKVTTYFINVYDNAGVSEYQDKKVTTYFINVYDNAGVSEYQDKLLTVYRVNVYDGVGVQESAQEFIPINYISVADLFTAQEYQLFLLNPYFLTAIDSVTVAEYKSANTGAVSYYDLSVYDGVGVQEYQDKLIPAYLLNVYDSVGVQDYKDTPSVSYAINVHEDVTAQEYVDRPLAYVNINVHEDVTAQEYQSYLLYPYFLSVIDYFTVIDYRTVNTGLEAYYDVSTYERFALQEYQDKKVTTYFINVYEDVTAQEYQDKLVPTCYVNVYDSTRVQEYKDSQLNPYLLNIADSITVIDYRSVNTGAIAYYELSVYDNVGIQEYLDELLTKYYLNVYEGVSLQEYQERVPTPYFISVHDDVTAQEYQDRAVTPYFVDVHDDARVSELAQELAPFYLISTAEAFTAQEYQSERLNPYYITSVDVFTVSEASEEFVPFCNINSADLFRVSEYQGKEVTVRIDASDKLAVSELTSEFSPFHCITIGEALAVSEYFAKTTAFQYLEIDEAETFMLREMAGSYNLGKVVQDFLFDDITKSFTFDVLDRSMEFDEISKDFKFSKR